MENNKNIFYLADGVPQRLVSQCINCGAKYGKKPYLCCACGQSGKITDITPCNQ